MKNKILYAITTITITWTWAESAKTFSILNRIFEPIIVKIKQSNTEI